MKPIERKFLRMKGRIRQVDAAQAIGCHRTTISLMENEGYDVPERHIFAYERYLLLSDDGGHER